MKKWNGSSWTNAVVKKWNGSSWVNAVARSYGANGWNNIGKTLKSVTIGSKWSQLYDANNKQRKDRSTGTLQQGKMPNDNVYGISKSLIAFDTTNVVGKDITEIRVYLRSIHWYYDKGGVAHIGWHGHNSKPTAFSHNRYSGITRQFTSKVSEQWITMPSEFIQGVKNGSIKGVSIYYNSAEWHGYGLFSGHGSDYAPKMQVYYNE